MAAGSNGEENAENVTAGTWMSTATWYHLEEAHVRQSLVPVGPMAC